MYRQFLTTSLLVCLISFTTYNAQAFTIPLLSRFTTPIGNFNPNYNSSIWADMRRNFQLQDDTYVPAVQTQIRWWQQHKSYLYQLLEHARPYIYYVYQQTENRNLPAELALIPLIESRYNPFAYSNVGALGLWQMMPGTASGFGLKINWWYDGRRDVIASTTAALNYFTYLYNFFDRNWQLAIAAYDCGEGNVLEALQHNQRLNQKVDFWNLALPAETHYYLPKLLALAAIIKNPNHYGIELPYIPNQPYFAAVDVHSQIDISEVAKLADVNIALIRQLNSGFRRWATGPDGPYTILVPINHVNTFVAKLNAIPKRQRVTWQHYYVRSGDTLSGIAHRFNTNVPIIQQVNGLKTNIIHVKQSLLIPESYHGRLTSNFLEKPATIAEEHLPGPQRLVYIVQTGNTLWNIAKRFNVSVREIRFWNNLTSKREVLPGEQLTIWLQKSHRHHPITINYVVKQGDSLDKIAHKFNTTVGKIKELNHLSSNVIKIKETLKIPTTMNEHSQHLAQRNN